VGTTADGTAAQTTEITYGVLISGSGNVVGTDGDGTNDAAEGNVLSGNHYGLLIEDLGGAPTGNVLAGNKFGTNAAGTAAVPNASFGVYYFNTTVANTRVGTNSDGVSDAAERNIISGNGQGGLVLFGTNSIVAGNYFGVGADGIAMIANGGAGIN